MTEWGPRWLLLAVVVLAAPASAADPAAKNVCVPGADGRWNCGSDEQPPIAAALPERPGRVASQPVPPVLLMDPERFRVSDPPPAALAADDQVSASQPVAAAQPARIADAPSPPAPAPRPSNPAPVLSAPAPATVIAVPRASPAGAGLRNFAGTARSGYTLQLAAAQSQDGFARRLRELGLAADSAFAVPVMRNGNPLWLLCTGEFADARTAMAAVPAGATGAFAKPLAQLHAESGR